MFERFPDNNLKLHQMVLELFQIFFSNDHDDVIHIHCPAMITRKFKPKVFVRLDMFQLTIIGRINIFNECKDFSFGVHVSN